MVFGTEMTIRTKGYSDIINVTGKVSQIATESKVSDGIINISVIGSTASVSTIEFEPALTADF
ncbi:MAG: YjbQ family protein, partial [Chitinispirillia bacterium]